MLSIVIVNWNTRDLLRACLASLPWDGDLALDVVVVDNGSSDDSAAMVASQFPQVRLERNAENLGFVRATNQGLAVARGEWLLLLNSDTEVRSGSLTRLLATLQAHPEAGAVGPLLLNSDGSSQRSFGPFPRVVDRFFPDRFERRYVARVTDEASRTGQPVPVGWLGGAALLTTRAVLRAVGGLDERWFMWYDDLDWCRRLARAGYLRLFDPEAVVVHHGRASAGKLADHKLAEQLLDSEYLYLRVHEGRLTTALVFGLRLAKALARCVRSGSDRDEARFCLAYHRARWRRFVWAPLPPPRTHLDTP